MCISFFFFLFVCGASALAQSDVPKSWSTIPFNAPSFPLAVKTPYVNAWSPQGHGAVSISDTWPKVGSTFFTNMGWFSIISVDGASYRLMGGPDAPSMGIASQVAVEMTPTRTSVLSEAGPVTVNTTYLSSVAPDDLVQQSLPFSYYYVSIISNSTHDIKIYSDISGEWMSGNNSLQSNWSATDDGSVVYLQTQLTEPSPFQELNDRPLDGIAYHAMLPRSGISWQIGEADAMRGVLPSNRTTLNNTVDPKFHPVGDPFDVLSFIVDLGTIQSTSDPIVWVVGVVRDPVVQFANSSGQIEERRAYYWSKYSTIHDVIVGVLNNFENALDTAIALDNQILHDGSQISPSYSDLLVLSARQAMGAIDFTIGQDSSGNWITSDVKAFLRGAGGIGSGGVNGVDVIYAASPIYLYLNPAILGYLLKPLLEYQESGLYTNQYAAIDIGETYSMATGNNKQHDEGIEQSGNMLILSYAHAQRTGDTSLISQHYNLLRGWAEYLVNNSLSPQSQVTSLSDAISATNQTNLALKGIIGIGAMARISSAVGEDQDAERYQAIASAYVQQWRSMAFSTDHSHFVKQFGQDNSYSLLYNLFAHKLLQLDLLPDNDFVTQTAFYKSKLGSSSQFGLPLDSDNVLRSRSDWMMFTAAIASDNTLRDTLISQIHAYASANLENQPFDVVYNPLNGSQVTGASSPAQGAMFALLANNVPVKLATPVGKSANLIGSGKVGAIVGGVVGVVGTALAAFVMFLLLRRRRSRRESNNKEMRQGTVDPLVFSDHPKTSQYTHRRSTSSQLISALNEKKRRIDNFDAGSGTTSYTTGPSMRGGLTNDPEGVPQRLVPDLRREVDNLRRELELIRHDREISQEAPPLYDAQLGAEFAE